MTRAFLISLAMLCVAGPTSAQDTVALKVAETRRAMDAFAECVVKRHHDDARDYVLSRVGAPASPKRRNIYDSDCLDVDTNLTDGAVTLQLPHQEMRFALAQALIPRDLKTFDPKQITVSRGADVPKQPEGLDDYDKTYFLLDAYSECVVQRNASGVRDLVNTRLNGSGEGQAFQSLMPALGACLDRGKQFGTDRTTLRGSLALAYYRLALASEAAQPGAAQ